MPLYRSPEERASETVTIRLTIRERRMLDHLAKLEESTLTDFIRGLIFKRADELGVDEPPPPIPKRRPGRPKMKKRVAHPAPSTGDIEAPATVTEAAPPKLPTPSSFPAPSSVIPPPPPDDEILDETLGPYEPPEEPLVEVEDEEIAIPIQIEAPESPDVPTVKDLIERFRETFAHRADGTKRELADTMDFFFSDKSGSPIISPSLPVEDLNSERLRSVREAVRTSELRLAKKNLHLTYFRMLLHFGVKERDFDIRVNPSRDLEPLTITESNEGWRFFTGRSD